jgi:hypothetical protein
MHKWGFLWLFGNGCGHFNKYSYPLPHGQNKGAHCAPLLIG